MLMLTVRTKDAKNEWVKPGLDDNDRVKRVHVCVCKYVTVLVAFKRQKTFIQHKLKQHRITNTFFCSSRTVLIFSSFLANISLSRSSNENGTTSVVWCSRRGWNGIPMCGTGLTLTGIDSTCSTVDTIFQSHTYMPKTFQNQNMQSPMMEARRADKL